MATRPLGFDIEQLEKRTLLSATFRLGNVPQFSPTTSNLTDVRSGPFAKGGGALADIYTDYLKWRNTGARDIHGNLVPFKPTNELLSRIGTNVGVTIRTTGNLDSLISQLRPLGIQLINRKPSWSLINAWIPIGQLHTLVSNPNVSMLRGLSAPTFRQQGVVDNQANQAMNADQARAVFGVKGSGVTVGVLSDSVNSANNGILDSRSTGDLPGGINVLEDSFGEDEGRAIMELIYDMAPGAGLAFATAEGGQQHFADNIERLQQEAGANVIVDDVGYLDEPFFQEGVIGDAISTVRNAGATYLTSAGNSAFGGFEKTIDQWDPQPDGTSLVDWKPGKGIDSTMRIHVNTGGFFALEWDNPYNGVVGDVTADLDIEFHDPVTHELIAQGTDNNFYTGVPVELVALPSGDYDMTVRLANLQQGAAPPTIIKFAPQQPGEITKYEYPITETSVTGHSGSRYAISVGAVPFFGAQPFIDDIAQVNNELFSSAGPVTQIFYGDGRRRPTPLVLDKPDLSGIDGGNTTFFQLQGDIGNDGDSFPNFFGTSAAAPDVAAVAALMKSYKPDLTPDQITAGLISSARLHPLNGSKARTWDRQGGFGLVDAVRALQSVDTAPYVNIERVSPDPRSTPVDQVSFTFNKPVTGFDISDLVLQRGSLRGPNLLTSDQTLTTTDNVTWILSGLGDLTDTDGTYSLTLKAAASGIMDFDGNGLRPDSREVFHIKNAVPAAPTNLTATPLSRNSIQLEWVDNSSTETRFRIERGTNPDFTAGLKVINVAANTTSVVDGNLDPNTKYYYRVRAFNGEGYSGGSRANAFTLSNGDVIVDNHSAKLTGSWTTSTSGTGIFGANYLTDGDTGKGTKTATYIPDLPITGKYFVYARWVNGSNRATNVPIQINSADGSKTVVVDQKNTGDNGNWILLGTFNFNEGTHGSLTISNTGTNGTVVADAVRFQSSVPVTNKQAEAMSISSANSASTSVFGTNRIDKPDDDLLNLIK
jgi:hypothetical protein